MSLPQIGAMVVLAGLAAFDRDSAYVMSRLNQLGNATTKLAAQSAASSAATSGQAAAFGVLDAELGKNAFTISPAVAKGAAAIGIALGVALASGAFFAAKFQDDMNYVQNITRASSKEMGQLGEKILDTSRKSRVGLSDIIKGSEELAQAGVEAQDQLNGALEAEIQLLTVAHGQLNPAGAAAIISQSMHAFKLEVEDVARVTNAATLVQLASVSTYSDWVNIVSKAAQPAANLRYTIEDLAVAATMAGNAGIRGTEIGAGLRQMFQRLENPTKEATDFINQYGLSLYDAEGNVRSFRDVAESLNAAFADNADGSKKMSDEERNTALSTVFSTRALNVTLAVTREGARGYDQYREALSKIDTAKLTDNMLKPLDAQIVEILNNFKALAIMIGNVFLPVLQRLAGAFLDLLQKIPTNAFDGIRNAIDKIATTAEVAGGVLQGPLAVGFALVGATIAASFAPQIFSATAALSALLVRMAIVAGAAILTALPFIGLGLIFAEIALIAISQWDKISKAAQDTVSLLGILIEQFANWLMDTWNLMVNNVGTAWSLLWDSVGKNASSIANALGTIIANVAGSIASNWANMTNAVGTAWANLWNQAGPIVTNALNGIANALNSFFGGLASNPLLANDPIVGIFKALGNISISAAAGGGGFTGYVNNELAGIKSFAAQSAPVVEAFAKTTKDVVDTFAPTLGAVKDSLLDLGMSIGDATDKLIGLRSELYGTNTEKPPALPEPEDYEPGGTMPSGGGGVGGGGGGGDTGKSPLEQAQNALDTLGREANQKLDDLITSTSQKLLSIQVKTGRALAQASADQITGLAKIAADAAKQKADEEEQLRQRRSDQARRNALKDAIDTEEAEAEATRQAQEDAFQDEADAAEQQRKILADAAESDKKDELDALARLRDRAIEDDNRAYEAAQDARREALQSTQDDARDALKADQDRRRQERRYAQQDADDAKKLAEGIAKAGKNKAEVRRLNAEYTDAQKEKADERAQAKSDAEFELGLQAETDALKARQDQEQRDLKAAQEQEDMDRRRAQEDANLEYQKQQYVELNAFKAEQDNASLAAKKAADQADQAEKARLDAIDEARHKDQNRRQAEQDAELENEALARREKAIDDDADRQRQGLEDTLRTAQQKIREDAAQQIIDLQVDSGNKLAVIKREFLEKIPDILEKGGDAIQPEIDHITELFTTRLDDIAEAARNAAAELAAALGAQEAYNNISQNRIEEGLPAPGEVTELEQHADGGMVGGPTGKPKLIIAHGGEVVLSNASVARLTSVQAAETRSSGTNFAPHVVNNHYDVHASYANEQSPASVGMDLRALIAMSR